MTRPIPAETKLLIAVWHRFTLWRPTPEMSARIRERWPEMRVVHLPNYDRLDDELPDTDIFVGYALRSENLPRAKKLKWLHSTAAGVGQLMYPELRESGIAVTNASGVHSVAMAEHLIGTLVVLARDFPRAMRFQAKRLWAQQEMWDSPRRPRELAGQTVLLVGFGAIGRAFAERARALGMHIWAVTRSGQAAPALVEKVFAASQLEAALPQADFVILAAPETPETHHLIGARQLAAMKPSAFLINVARGSLVDEPALIAALERGQLAGAALDVASQEPLPPESPLWRMDNVFITPHTSSSTDLLWTRQTDLLLQNLDRWFAGRELINRVDFARGY